MLEKREEGSLDSTARSPPMTRRGTRLRGGRSCPAIRCGGAVPSGATGRDAREVVEASRSGPSRVAPTNSLEASRQEKLYHKVVEASRSGPSRVTPCLTLTSRHNPL
jgi:hypothetical protein